MAEIGIPVLALAGLYVMNKQKKTAENFSNKTGYYENRNLPNVDVPNTNYPNEYPVEDAPNDLTSQLSTVNKFDGKGVYTDKYFSHNGAKDSSTQNSQMFSNQVPDSSTQYVSMTGEKVDAGYFQHENMTPFFGSHLRTVRTDANVTEGLIDNYTGSGSQTITKTERAPLFSPEENYQYANGAPNMSDFYQSRVNPSNKMSNVKPFAEQHVAPGLGGGYEKEGIGGYNSGLMGRDMYMPKSVDELRVDNKQKASGVGLYGHEGPALSSITNRGVLGTMEKNRVETSFEMGRERLLTTTGRSIAPTNRAIHVLKDGNRQETTTEYTGNAKYTNTSAGLVDGEYMPSKHIDLGPVPIAPAFRGGANGGNESDHGYKSGMKYNNNRSINDNNTYFGAFGGAIGAVVSPLLDSLRPSRRENAVGTLRPYQNPANTVSNSYVFNPSDKPATTIKETTETSKGHLFINKNQRGGAYAVTENQPVINNRITQNISYTGIGGAGERGREPRTYDAEYNQRNNDLKSSTLASYTPSGNTNVYSGEIHMTSKARDQHQNNKRALDPTMPRQTPSVNMMGAQSAQHTELYSNIQLDRNQPDMMSQLKGNPFAISHLKGL
jgi:hypothetical protein